MQAIDSCQALAKKLNRKLCVIWTPNKRCNCRFRDLFITQNLPYRLIDLPKGFFAQHLHRKERAIFSRLNSFYMNQQDVKRRKMQPEWFEGLSKYPLVYLTTFNRFYQHPDIPLFSSFHPAPALQQKIIANQTNNQIGIHVRRTDNRQAIARSPLSLYIKQMEKELREDPSVTFFLATDDPDVESELRTTFPEKITCHPKQSLDRNNPRAIRDAAVDLYSLANCSKLIGCHWSSFTDAAAAINGIDLHTIFDTSEEEVANRRRNHHNDQ